MSIPRIRVAADLIESGQVDQAIPLLDRLSRLFPFYPAPYVLLARALEARGDTEAALAAWRQAHFLLPENEMTRAGLRRNSHRLLSEEEDPLDDDLRDVDLTPADEFEDILRRVTTAEPRPEPETLSASSPKTPVSPLADFDIDDLDELIAQLESGRIPVLPEPEEPVGPPETGDDEEVVSETLARIYFNQKQYVQAARIYRILASQRPERAGAYLERAAELESMIRERPGTTETGRT